MQGQKDQDLHKLVQARLTRLIELRIYFIEIAAAFARPKLDLGLAQRQRFLEFKIPPN